LSIDMTLSIAERVQGVPHWYHQIELPDGTVTPGINLSKATLAQYEEMGLPARFDGLRVLDIGCADGFYSFLAETRGAAEVIAVDYRLPTASGFSVAADILGSKVRHVVANVYDLDPALLGTFDFVFFIGVLYHLRNPLLALDRVRAMARTGGQVLVETHVIDWPFRTKLIEAGLPPENADVIVGLPMWDFYKGDSLNGDFSNKWAPTLAGLHHICGEAELQPKVIKGFGSRGATLCDVISDQQLQYHRQFDSATGIAVP
jgi:tRNA (mo5U34)-methyltransferase